MAKKAEGPQGSTTTVTLPTIDELAAQLEKTANPVPDVPDQQDVVTHKASDEKTVEPAKVDDPPADDDPDVKAALETAINDKPAASAPPDPAPKKDPASARFAALARREREARQKQADAENRAKAVEDRERQLLERETRLKAVKNPLDLLKEHGYSYADATQAILGGYKPAEPDPVDTKLSEKLNPVSEQVAELRKAQAEALAAIEELKAHRVEVARREVRQSIQAAAQEGGFEYINVMGDEAYTLVEDVIGEHYKKYKRILSYTEACDRVERYYDEKAQKLRATKKYNAAASTAAPSTKTPTKPSNAPVSAKESKTLTNSLSASARAKIDIDKLGKNDAIAQLAGQLRYLND